MKLIAWIFGFAIVMALQGCATIEKSGLIENQISCAVDGSNGLVNSMYGPLGITSKIKQSQADVICARLKPAPPASAAAASPQPPAASPVVPPVASAKLEPAPTPPPVAAAPPATLSAPVPSPLPTPLPATVPAPLPARSPAPALWPLPVVPGEPVVPLAKP